MTFYISRYKNIDAAEFEIEVVTPMFLGGADPTKAELRVPSIKAAMRFWWRALYDGNDIENMAKKEAEIFGSVANKAVVTVKLIAWTGGRPCAWTGMPRGTMPRGTSLNSKVT